MEIVEKKISINGLSINYAEAGVGKPMIFLHNGGGFWQSWEHQIKYFSKRYRVYGIDWPGFGESDLPDGLVSSELLSETLSEFIHLKNLEDVILIGNCIGGSASLLYNMNRPEIVHKLIIFNICPGDLIFRIRAMRGFISHLNQRKRSKSLFSSLLIFGFTKTPIKRRFPRILFGKKYDKKSPLFERYVEKFKLRTQTTSRVNMVYSMHTFNLLNILGENKAPKHLLVWGEHNSVASLNRHGYYHFERLNSSQFEVIKDAGHLCMYEKPNEVIRLLEAYIAESE